MPDILEEHVEGIGFLWGQWCSAIRSPEYTLKEIGDLEERIRSHVGGAVAVGEPAHSLLEDALTEDDRFAAFAAGYALLHAGGDAGAASVLEAFSTADEEKLLGLEEAMSYGPVQDRLAEIKKLFETAPIRIAAAAAEILTFHGALQPTDQQIKRFIEDDDEGVRRRGWRLVGHLCYPLDADTYAAALQDEEPAVRRTALESGSWCRVDEVSTFVRTASEELKQDNLDALYVLAVLGSPEDLPRFMEIVDAEDLGPGRYQLAGTFGHPALMPKILQGLEDKDPATAAAAGAAFTKMTAVEVSSDQRVTVGMFDDEEVDEFEAQFLDEVFLPDVNSARAAWDEMAPRFSNATRMIRGYDLERGVNDPAFLKLDMESRWEVCLRSKFHGKWDGSPLGLEVFPQKR